MDDETFSINLGDAFLIETPPNGMHLYIAIMPLSENRYLFVNVTKRKPISDTSCIIKPGMAVPSFIIQESVVAYKFAREFELEEISSLIESGTCEYKGVVSPNILYKIQIGGISSKQIKNKYKNNLKKFLDISE